MSLFTTGVKDVNGDDIRLIEQDGMRYPEMIVNNLMESDNFNDQLNMVQNLNVRDDDVFMFAFMKSGMHWLWEIVTMITKNTTEYEKTVKENSMMDFRSSEHLQTLPSPRVLNMHFPARYIPKEALAKRRPIIHVMRNPKDVFVSYYHHYNNLMAYQHVDSFSTFLKMMIGENGFYLKFPWFQYELEWEKFTNDNPDYPILNIYYEDMKEDLKKSVRQISSFLKANISDDLVKSISEKCDITKLRAAALRTDIKNHPVNTVKVDENPLMYRKGMVGDWKNHFTVAENERMDTWLAKHLVKTDLKFRYTL